MKYKVLRTSDSPKKRKLKGCSTWGYQIVDTKKEAEKLAKEWKQLGYYIEIKEVQNERYTRTH